MDQTNVDYLMAGSNYKDDNLLISKYPVNTVGNTLIKILPDNSTKKTVEISTDGIENLENNYLCLPSGATHLDISNIPADIISKTYTNDMLCYTFIKSQQTNHEISYSTLPLNSSLQDNIYTFNLYSNTGLSTNYDIEFDFDSSLGSIEPINNNYIIKSGNYIYTGRSTGFVQFSFKIIKNG